MCIRDRWRECLLQYRDSLRAITLPIQHESIPADATPDTKITVYHGVEYENSEGNYTPNAWTLSARTAMFFASRVFVEGGEVREVLQATMTLEELNTDATFFCDSRNESEVYFHEPPEYGLYSGALN